MSCANWLPKSRMTTVSRLALRSLVAALRRRGMERGLEIGLDLGIVRRQDAMAGVGRLAMDGPASVAAAR